jgi:magnesium chelatase subunit D
MSAIRRPHLPFSAVVGQEQAKTALLLAAIEPRLGGVLLRGDKGSAKTTLARGLVDLLPGDAPFVELPLGATEDRVLGSLDVAALLGDGAHAFRPGLLAAAHGGVLYVDEINLLADHLVDALLDVAVSGVNRVERDGMSHTHPARFVLVGSMNPEEGELRPQLLDRFGIACDVRSPADPADRAEIVRRQLAFDAAPSRPPASGAFAAADAALAERLAAARPAGLPDAVIETATRLALAVGAEGLRADLSLCRAATALAGWERRADATDDDLARVAPLVLGHRRRRNPFDAPGISDDDLADAMRQATQPPTQDRDDESPEDPGDLAAGAGPGKGDGDRHASGKERGRGSNSSDGGGNVAGAIDPGGGPGDAGQGRPTGGAVPAASEVIAPAADLAPPPLPGPGPARARATASTAAAGRGASTAATTGRFLRPTPYDGAPDMPIAATATAVAYATRRATEPAARLGPADLRGASHEQRTGSLVVIAVDTSGSMHAQHRIALAKAAAFGLLADAYRRRDRVALVTFRGEGADLVLRPTGSVEIARARLAELPSGGTTPLAAGLDAVADLVRSTARAANGSPAATLAVILTDGRATTGGGDPLAAVAVSAAGLARTGTRCLVIDSETGPTRLGLARHLAEQLGAAYLHLDELTPAAPGPPSALAPSPTSAPAPPAAAPDLTTTIRATLERLRA